MKIIAGKLKGRNIEIPRSELRPTLDRSKETLFNIIQFDIEGTNVLDLFAGSGSLGLEAFSRGAVSVTFVDNDSRNTTCISQSCTRLNIPATVLRQDFALALAQLSDKKFDIVFIDPPFAKTEYYQRACILLQQYRMLDNGCIVVLEHSIKTILPDAFGFLTRYKERKMGKMMFSFYTIAEEK